MNGVRCIVKEGRPRFELWFGQATNAEVNVMAVSGLRATIETTVREDGMDLHCLEGIPIAEGKPMAVFPGELPPTADDVFPEGTANPDRYYFPEFKPPQAAASERGMPHLRLDRALQFLIGDAL